MLSQLAQLHQAEFSNPYTNVSLHSRRVQIQQPVNKIAGKMRNEDQVGCFYLQAMSDLMEITHVSPVLVRW
jgi:hypothetical protein